jgi:pyruvate kinase
MRRTKIVCTLGPASFRPETIAAMIRAGMDVARLNTSHGSMAEHARSVELVRMVAAQEGKPVGVLMDLGGPKLRTGATADGSPLLLVRGDSVRVTGISSSPLAGTLTIDYPHLTTDVAVGERVLIDDGNVELAVESVTADCLECRVVHGGSLKPGRGVTFPQSNLTMKALTERDRQAIVAGVAAGVDLFALSFVADASDIIETRDFIASLGADIPIVAKIERRRAIENLDAILAEADGAMVARGDLGVELAPEDVPVQQRRIIGSAARNMIPVITATQMLESMVTSPRPTRAESSDVANAVWDLSDALMLSQETAVGQFPVEAVAMMDRIIRRAEEFAAPDIPPTTNEEGDDHSYVVALAARRIVESDPNMKAIVCFTRSGYTALLLSKVHPSTPIIAVSPSATVCRRLALARSVVPVVGPLVDTSEKMLRMVDEVLVQGQHMQEGEEVVVVASLPVQAAGTTNFLKLHRIGESKAYK